MDSGVAEVVMTTEAAGRDVSSRILSDLANSNPIIVEEEGVGELCRKLILSYPEMIPWIDIVLGHAYRKTRINKLQGLEYQIL